MNVFALTYTFARQQRLLKTRYQKWPTETDVEIRAIVMQCETQRQRNTSRIPRVGVYFETCLKYLQNGTGNFFAGTGNFRARNCFPGRGGKRCGQRAKARIPLRESRICKELLPLLELAIERDDIPEFFVQPLTGGFGILVVSK
jgi:hypothetical protein